MGDEYTDIGNKEQLTCCVRSVTNELQIHENLLGLSEFTLLGKESRKIQIKSIEDLEKLAIQG